MGVSSGCGEQEVGVAIVGEGGIYGCACKEVYTYLSLLLLYLFFFAAASLLFVHF